MMKDERRNGFVAFLREWSCWEALNGCVCCLLYMFEIHTAKRYEKQEQLTWNTTLPFQYSQAAFLWMPYFTSPGELDTIVPLGVFPGHKSREGRELRNKTNWCEQRLLLDIFLNRPFMWYLLILLPIKRHKGSPTSRSQMPIKAYFPLPPPLPLHWVTDYSKSSSTAPHNHPDLLQNVRGLLGRYKVHNHSRQDSSCRQRNGCVCTQFRRASWLPLRGVADSSACPSRWGRYRRRFGHQWNIYLEE